jgi:hypothetical protein
MRSLIFVVVIAVSLLLASCAGGVTRPEPDLSAAKRSLSLDETMEAPSFEANGGTAIDATIDGYKTAVYVVGAVKGQLVTVQLESDNPNAYFDVLEKSLTGGTEKIFSTDAACRGARIRAASNTTFIIRPFLARSLAQSNASVPYRLCINRCEEGLSTANCEWKRGDLSGI